ncbi:MAG: eukaryotic-like serine/threonine-protein kinase [Pseudonocardiales bacterium]|nr:eukaryotic-like serine/threonine-protein kinase [Pseudonocardiales bacterium]
MSTPDDAPRIGGRYRLEQRIGAGAMGAVWRGTDELLNRTVAVKELLAAAEPPTAAGVEQLEESRQRLMREGRIGARLQHPHVISMFDVVVHEDRPWLVMEYLPSRSLAAVLNETGPMGPREAAEVGRQVADGLAAAHAAGVVHRDVKPGNVLIADDGRVKLTDFGVSRAVDDVQLTRTGLIAGTPAFLSPEVARGQVPTAASDIFALGATLYASVEGHPPFGLDDNAYALLHKVATESPEPPQHAGALTALIMRLLSDDPDQRPTAEQARDTLAAVAEGRVSPDAGSTGTAVLEGGAAAVAGQSARTAVAYRDTRAGSDRSDAPEMVATAAAMPPVTTAPRPPKRAGTGDTGRPAGGARRPVLFALLAVGVVALVVLAVVLSRGGGETPSAPTTSSSAAPTPDAARPPAPAPAPTTEAAPTTTATAPTTTTSTSTTSTTTTTTTSGDAPTSTEAVAFVQNYYGLLPGNTGAAWDRLGPTAQSQSGGRGNYDRFYAGMRSVTLENARSSGGNTVSATIVFVQNNGTTTREGYRFVVGGRDGRQVIESFSRA